MSSIYKLLFVTLFLLALTANNVAAQISIISDEFDLQGDYDLFIFKKNNKYAVARDTSNATFIYDTIITPRPYDDFLFIRKDGKWGALANDKTKLIDVQYERIERTYYDEDHNTTSAFVVKKSGKYGTVDRDGKTLLPLIYDNITTWVEGAPDGHFVVKNGKMGWANSKGKLLIPCEYDSISWNTTLQWFKAKRGIYIGMVDSLNIIKIPFNNLVLFDDYYFLNSPSENKIVVLRDGIWYYINSDDKILKSKIPKNTIELNYKGQFSNPGFTYTVHCMLN